LKTGLGIKANGFREQMYEKGTEFKFGPTDQSMKDGGEIIQQMVEED